MEHTHLPASVFSAKQCDRRRKKKMLDNIYRELLHAQRLLAMWHSATMQPLIFTYMDGGKRMEAAASSASPTSMQHVPNNADLFCETERSPLVIGRLDRMLYNQNLHQRS